MKKKRTINQAKPRKIQKPASSVLQSKTQNSLIPSAFAIQKKKKGFFKAPEKKEKENQNEQKLREQYEALNNKYQFLMAEYANYKKHNMKQMENLRKYEGQNLIQKLLDKVIDTFDRALEQEVTEQNMVEFKKGIFMIYENFKDVLTQAGVKELDCKGQLFDPALHCALDSISVKEVPPEHIVHVIKKAYLFNDRLIRPAEVIVSEKSEVNAPEQTPEQNKDAGE